MIDGLRSTGFFLKLQKRPWYYRLRQYLPTPRLDRIVDDRDRIDGEVVRIDWPTGLRKPCVGIVQDYGVNPRWTKYCRFLDNNGFPYQIYNIHRHDWMEQGASCDIVVGIVSSQLFDLQEMQRKYFVLETFLGKHCFPSTAHALLYEDKLLEAYITKAFGLRFVETHISQDREDALRLVENLHYPLVSKIVPSSGSIGVEMVSTPRHARSIVEKAFSVSGRKSHVHYFHQKNYVYFQQYVPNDGYDIRVMVIGNWVFGYYRKALAGDFRASGMHQVEKRALPAEAMKLALALNEVIKSPLLVVDMLHGLDGLYHIIEFSPTCLMETPEQLHVDGIPGVYVFDGDGTYRFMPGRFWLHELSLRQFLLQDYLPKVIEKQHVRPAVSDPGGVDAPSISRRDERHVVTATP